MRLTENKGVEVALDSVGGSITGEALKSLAPGGRVVHMGYPAGTDLTVELSHSHLGSGRCRFDEHRRLQYLLPVSGRFWGRVVGGPATPPGRGSEADHRPDLPARPGG